ncbi:MAG TPA: hypothetical protein V6C91_10890, partial [Coleofasciculaceae cyanobacterium]
MNEISAPFFHSNFQVVHAVPGRVRLRSTDSELTPVLDEVAQQLRQQNGVCEVQTNPVTNSLVITFDERTLSLSKTLEILQTAGVSASEQTQPVSEVTLETLLSGNPDLPEKGVQAAKSIIPLVAGMLVTGALGIEGLLAFPVYMITDRMTREVIKQIESITQEDNSVETAQENATEINGKLATVVQEEQLDALQTEVTYTVVHEIPGRIRFRVPRLAEDVEYAQRLTALLKTDAKVVDV